MAIVGVADGAMALQQETARRACRSALWLALDAAQRCEWRDLVEQIYDLHSVATERLHEDDLAEWRRLLDAEGPNQPEGD